jgi:imidazolonepropionase-like amidohydrolase
LPKTRVQYAAAVFREIESTLRHGFTTVHDAGYTDAGFKLTIDSGMVPGPRLLISNGPLSQTPWRWNASARSAKPPG